MLKHRGRNAHKCSVRTPGIIGLGAGPSADGDIHAESDSSFRIPLSRIHRPLTEPTPGRGDPLSANALATYVN